jgi:hypothetical protein
MLPELNLLEPLAERVRPNYREDWLARHFSKGVLTPCVALCSVIGS